MPNQYDYDESTMAEKVLPFSIPVLSPAANLLSHRQPYHPIIQDLDRLIEGERHREQKRIQQLKQKQHHIGEQIGRQIAKKDKKIRQLEEQQKKKIISQCTFQPKTTVKTQPRSLQQFLKQQNQFTEKIQQKRNTLKQNIEAQKNKNTYQPKTNPRNPYSNQKKVPVYERLYALKDKQNEDDGNFRQNEEFQPKITEKGKKMTRNVPIDQLLYKDALRRQEKSKQTAHYSQTNHNTHQKPINFSNEKYVAQKFIKEYYGIIQALGVPSSTQMKIDYLVFNEILKQLGFVHVEEQGENSHERQLIHEAYQFLQGYQVNAKNLCVFLLALIGVFHINPVNFQDGQVVQPEKDLALDQSQGRKIQRTFDLFKRNRLFSENSRKQPVSASQNYSFKPHVNKANDDMADKHRQQMLQQVNEMLEMYPQIDFNIPKDGIITPTDLLVMHNKVKQLKKMEKRDQLDQLQLDQCTFKPTTLPSTPALGNSKDFQFDASLGLKKSNQLYNFYRELQNRKESLKVSRQVEDPTMKECTFAPNIHNFKTPQTDMSKFKTKQVEQALYRMKKGRQQWQQKKKLLERGQPSSHKKQKTNQSQKKKSVIAQTPILLLDVNLGDRMERLTLYSGDQQRLQEVAHQFAIQHDIDEESELKLLELLEVEMESMLAKIPEDEESEENLEQ